MRAAPDAAAFGSMLLQRLGRSADPSPSIRQRIQRWPTAPAGVLAPDSADAIAEVLGVCTAEGWPVHVVGAAGRTRPSMPHAIVLSASRLDAVTEHEPADLVIGAGAGCRLSSLAHRLAAVRQWLPLDPPGAAEGTLGAALATNAAGPLQAAHGTPRDLALGVEVITGDGRRLRFGGRVVKNVAGYDVVRLLIGSRGRLGVITHAFVRLRGLPRADTTLLVPVHEPRAGAEQALEIRDRLPCDSLELLSPAGAAAGEWTLAVRFTGSEAAVAASTKRLKELAPSARPVADGGDFWRALSDSETAAGAHECTRGLPSELPARLEHVFAQAVPGWRFAAHITAGSIRAWRADPVPEPLFAPLAGPRGREETLTRHLCAVFDPAGILQRAGEGTGG